jgi:hypothetical protein
MRRAAYLVFGLATACTGRIADPTATDQAITDDAISRVHRHPGSETDAAIRRAVEEAEACIDQCLATHRQSMNSQNDLRACADGCVQALESEIDMILHGGDGGVRADAGSPGHSDGGAADATTRDGGGHNDGSMTTTPDAGIEAPDVGVPSPDADVPLDTGSVEPDAGSDAPDSGPAAPDAEPAQPDATSLLPFGAACTTNADCQSNLCFNFQARGMFCTEMCVNGVCPEASSSGCNGMGVCKVP